MSPVARSFAAGAVIVLCTAFVTCTPAKVEAQAVSDVERAFNEANIRFLKNRQEPANFTLPLLSGGNTSLSSYRGKVVLLNFWATWCPPCRNEMPSMEILYNRFKNQGLEILAVDIGESTATVRQFIQENSYTFPVLMDSDSKAAAQYGIRSIPTTFILDREGMIISTVVGGIRWDAPKLVTAFDTLLKSR